MLAYEFRCAVCLFDGRIDNAPVGLDAAHVRWWSSEGPDEVANGLAMCSFHHLLLDRGVIGIDREHRVVVSKHFIGHSPSAQEAVTRWHGADLLEPSPGEPTVDEGFISWHASNVFRTPARSG